MLVPVQVHTRSTRDEGEDALGNGAIGHRGDVIELTALRDDEQTDPVVLFGQTRDGVLAGNLGAQLVEAGLDRGDGLIALRGIGERTRSGHHSLVLQPLSDDLGGVAAMHLEHEVLDPGARVVGDGGIGTEEAVPQLGSADNGSDGDDDNQRETRQSGVTATPRRSPAARPFATGLARTRTHRHRDGPATASPVVVGLLAIVPIAPVAQRVPPSLPHRRRCSSQSCRMATAAAWSMMPRC